MARDLLDLSCVPYDEPCTQVGADDYQDKAVKECQAYIRQLKRLFGEPPAGARLKLKYNPHDFGTYLSVVCEFETTNEAAFVYAFQCDKKRPANWDEVARAELKLTTA
jgi:hypothetical protein